MKVSIVVLTLNEIDGIRVVMHRIKKDWYDELVVIDGDSTDGTLEYLRSNDYKVFIQEKKGMGGAFTEAMKRVNGDIVVIFAPDGNSIPELIPDLVAKIKEGYDLAIASRYLDDAISYDDDVVTAFGNWMFTKLFNILFHSRYTDMLGMYRAFRKDIAKELEVDGSSNYWGTQILARATRYLMRVTEIPGDEPQRIGGKRKMRPLVNGVGELWTIFREFIR